jgi:transcriptional regulator of acetoin/glycerol metabolism
MSARVPRAPARSDATALASAGPFFATPQQRVARARELFFEEGVRPSGLVSELVIQSWTRCLGARRRPDEHIAFNPVTKSRIASTLARNRQLLEAASEGLNQLDVALAGTSVKAVLTSHDGVVVHATPTARGEGRLMPLVTRVGVDLGESQIGTGAPGVAARTGDVCVVHGGEHFFREISVMYCAAAPIRDARGEIAGVLDLSSEAEVFRFDAAAMVRLYATAIENRLLESQSGSQLLLRFQSSPALLHTPLEGLAAVTPAGRVAWFNGTGASLLGSGRAPASDTSAESLFGLDLEALLQLAHAGRAQPYRLANGLTLWVQASCQGLDAPPDGDPIPAPAPRPDTSATTDVRLTLQDASRDLIETTLADCQGNVSRAARRLGVSRGLLYRRIRGWGRA